MDRTTFQRLRVVIRGAVQGVGFRPFVYRLAAEMGLPGWVINSSQGVFIEVEGDKARLDTFLLRIEREKPPRSFIQSLESSFLDPLGFDTFEIRHSEESGAKSVLVLPDLAICPDCLREIFDPSNRRYLYPFTNCTNCGPRYSIIEGLPYDRPNTSMRLFEMCDECRAEYASPLDRRFHAQPNACPKCGPHLELWDRAGGILASQHDALLQAAEAIRRGQVVAVKGIGGFHLMVDARNDDAVQLLRRRKHREEKPLALMTPSLEQVKALCEVSELEERLLLSPESPIILLRRIGRSEEGRSHRIAPTIAPAPNPSLGIMLPYTPLHHILMAELGFPVVATSGNLSDEPICIDEHEALERLSRIADVFLVHNRPIVRHVDDSIVRVVLGREMVLRRARGYAPLPIPTHNTPGVSETPGVSSILAVGSHLKNSVAITVGENVFISQHIGDLETPQAYDAFRRVIADLGRLYEFQPGALACDLHPDYVSTHYARELTARSNPPLPVIAVQHHFAHIVSCMAENELIGSPGRALGVSWDGAGYGLDGTIWGGEFLLVNTDSARDFTRAAHLRTFRLPGGDRAIKEPRRTAFGLLYELFGDALIERTDLAPVAALSPIERGVIRQMIQRGLNAPLTSSAGRLFDACAALIGLRQRVNYEGQAAMELEFAAETTDTDEAYPIEIGDWRLEIRDWKTEVRSQRPEVRGQRPEARGQKSEVGSRKSEVRDERAENGDSISNLQSPISNNQSPLIVDWEPLIRALIADVAAGVPAGLMAAKFHNTLVEMIVAVAGRVGQRRVILSGGVFQNKYLLERTVRRLQAAGFHPYWHQRVPPNDGGIALGQAVAAAYVPIVRLK
ncbi:MAG: carbamoyltransferase HypF [Chloroflexi bacterium]|nr:carbamoyltransferase HypF [Chloroflexota bacterium]